MRGEFRATDSPIPSLGEAEGISEVVEHNDDHAFLYIPDLSAETGWSSHRVPGKDASRNDRQREPMGFRRR